MLLLWTCMARTAEGDAHDAHGLVRTHRCAYAYLCSYAYTLMTSAGGAQALRAEHDCASSEHDCYRPDGHECSDCMIDLLLPIL